MADAYLAGAGVGLGALTANGEASDMTTAPDAADLCQTLDVKTVEPEERQQRLEKYE